MEIGTKELRAGRDNLLLIHRTPANPALVKHSSSTPSDLIRPNPGTKNNPFPLHSPRPLRSLCDLLLKSKFRPQWMLVVGCSMLDVPEFIPPAPVKGFRIRVYPCPSVVKISGGTPNGSFAEGRK